MKELNTKLKYNMRNGINNYSFDIVRTERDGEIGRTRMKYFRLYNPTI